ncbi:MAG TPA: hypothetical protein VGW34_03385 [Allosphingosinicella sp.]|nr:hypothetical protein [Allosphingosinicella sp.]
MREAAFLMLLLAGCAAMAVSGCAPADISDGSATFDTCPSQSFPAFLHRFSESVKVQQTFTHFPLEQSRIVQGRDEPHQVRLRIHKNDLHFPLYPDNSIILSQRLSKTITEREKDAVVTLAKTDTDYLVTYHFKKTDCWYLAKIDDQSL